MAIHVQNLTFHIQKKFLSLSPIGWFLFSLFPIGRHLHFSLQIRIAENTPTSRFTIHIMKVPSSLLSTFMKQLAGLCQHHECGMLN